MDLYNYFHDDYKINAKDGKCELCHQLKLMRSDKVRYVRQNKFDIAYS